MKTLSINAKKNYLNLKIQEGDVVIHLKKRATRLFAATTLKGQINRIEMAN